MNQADGDNMEHKSILQRYLNGDYSLPYILFIYGVLICGVGFYSFYYVVFSIFPEFIIGWEGEVAIILIIQGAFSYLTFISIWKSSGKFKGSVGLVLFSRLLVVFMFIFYVPFYIGQYRSSIPYQISKELSLLPRMMSEEQRADSIELSNGNIEYVYSFVGIAVSDIDVEYFNKEMSKQLHGTCNKSVSTLIQGGLVVSYRYNDKDNKHIETIKITSDACKKY